MAGGACIAGDAYSVDAHGLAPWEFRVDMVQRYELVKIGYELVGNELTCFRCNYSLNEKCRQR
jgi:hypothetical protein